MTVSDNNRLNDLQGGHCLLFFETSSQQGNLRNAIFGMTRNKLVKVQGRKEGRRRDLATVLEDDRIDDRRGGHQSQSWA